MSYFLRIDWTISDILELDDTLTDEQCEKVLRRAYHLHDAEVGINWEVLQGHLNDILREERDESKKNVN